MFLEQEFLLLDEIVIWDNLIKWSLAQHPSIQYDIKEWNKEEITIMEKTLHRFIPLIRFDHISSEIFLLKVYPFKVLLSEDVIEFHMTQNNKRPNDDIDIRPQYIYDSIIIKPRHFAIFSSWIEKKNDSYYKGRNIPYGFNLLYRASRDGYSSAAFHSKCDDKGATIVIAKVKNSEQIIGGYNPLYWYSSYTYLSTRDSFIFSFSDKNNLQSAKVGYSNGINSVGGYTTNGPVFGGNSGCHLAVSGLSGYWFSNPTANNKSYPKIGIPEKNFNVDDYEVFQVVDQNYHLDMLFKTSLFYQN